MKRNTFWIPVLAGILLTGLFYVLGALFSGGGHSLAALIFLFPYGTALGLLWEDTPLEFIGGLLLVLQYPLYALILANVKGKGPRWLVLLVLLAVHATAVVIGLKVYGAQGIK
jgi:hypothetical protein